ncbi:hypothetical protein HYV49_01425 [Candidatus Pacearchaeota archaeon]|nr:hypothetical protein [Candidatus Pacearchaeota archaeon]
MAVLTGRKKFLRKKAGDKLDREEKSAIVRLVNDSMGAGNDLDMIIQKISDSLGINLSKVRLEYIYYTFAGGYLSHELEWVASIREQYNMTPDEYIKFMKKEIIAQTPGISLRERQKPRYNKEFV